MEKSLGGDRPARKGQCNARFYTYHKVL
jgi:hypothetical protein